MRYPTDFEWLRRAQSSPAPVKIAPTTAAPVAASRRSDLSRVPGNEPLEGVGLSLRDRRQLAARLARGESQLSHGLLVAEDGRAADFDGDGERRPAAPARASAPSSVTPAGSGHARREWSDIRRAQRRRTP